jgi:integrase
MLVANHLQPAARKAGISGQVGFHTLRRTLASALVANGSNIRLVQELLRHSNPLITLDAYARSTTPAKIEAQGWVMEQLLTEDSKAALAAAKPASTRTM